MNSSEMILTTSILAMLESRNALREKIAQAFDGLRDAMSIEKRITGRQYSTLESFLVGGRGHYFCLSDPQESVALAMKQLDAQFWLALMDQSGIRAFMSARRQKEFYDLISEAQTPPFEMNAIKSTFADLYEKRADMLEEGIVDLFRRLSWEFRTNNPVKIGRKLIVNDVLDSWGTANTHVTDMLDDLIRVLSVYDGKPIPEHRHGVYQVLCDTLHRGESVMETEYFSAKLYKKGTGHITFNDKAVALLDLCNRVIARRFPCALAAMDGRNAT
jgi:hypothetical protein